MSIQILQYEFLGPIPLDEWGPPMEKLVFLIMSRDKDRFNIVYAGDCEKTDDKSYFVQHSSFKCWVEKSGSEKSLYLAILPLFDASKEHRESVLNKIKVRYNPQCNVGEIVEPKPDYVVRKSADSSEKFSCPCCGSEMKVEQILEKSTLYRCSSCGISDTKLNS
ncbi:hypothetical protein AAA799E16_01157 [Marine Group I thaumarchaeote SCGC AAA799-E16]|uniref:Uncharacterized protein n=5 Tax=Marine Group I TaxID=905826 RepID=A0A087S6I1_9ARCH|nr:hypothetical protein AAA799N04_00890 [Marine Group I thaumarchaeote SCGC AAA799-N04]KER06147.1 hypothetical protein AAA799E16_01157 [Marine Group I thaumarchaeote SCGC AAA799-E16]KFM15883.1 hypothetical protein AAA799D11_01041 [Marine Group I thaumarchaeote SCGC AAA799-D11]KFM17448.1 hypothetical protein SCCGRSA3_01916 [Marine Group I thaumarchaeote SCGC RSA3]KFM21335.1 hypothetical protein AAA799B03_01110 [Marine Group I thaumarchaeote SCGC AAA799-B03]